MDLNTELDSVTNAILLDVQRMERGDDPALDARAIARDLDDMTRRANEADHTLVVSAADEACARELLPDVERQIAAMRDARELQREIWRVRATGDVARLRAITLAAPGPVSSLARMPMTNHGFSITRLRDAAARWRAASSIPADVRRHQARIAERIADERERARDQSDGGSTSVDRRYVGTLGL